MVNFVVFICISPIKTAWEFQNCTRSNPFFIFKWSKISRNSVRDAKDHEYKTKRRCEIPIRAWCEVERKAR